MMLITSEYIKFCNALYAWGRQRSSPFKMTNLPTAIEIQTIGDFRENARSSKYRHGSFDRCTLQAHNVGIVSAWADTDGVFSFSILTTYFKPTVLDLIKTFDILLDSGPIEPGDYIRFKAKRNTPYQEIFDIFTSIVMYMENEYLVRLNTKAENAAEIVELLGQATTKHQRWLKKLTGGKNSLFTNIANHVDPAMVAQNRLEASTYPEFITGSADKGREFDGRMFGFDLPIPGYGKISLTFNESDFVGNQLKIGKNVTGDYILICYDKGTVKKANEN